MLQAIRRFVEIASKRNFATLDDIVRRHVLPWATIRTENWRGDGNLSNLGSVQKTVNNYPNFVEPSTGEHTQNLESAWSHIMRATENKICLKAVSWNDHLDAVHKLRNDKDMKLYVLWSRYMLAPCRVCLFSSTIFAVIRSFLIFQINCPSFSSITR